MAHDIKKNGSAKSAHSAVCKPILRDKVFVERNSVIEEIMKNKNARPAYNVFIAIIFGMVIYMAAHEYIYKGRVNFGQRLIIQEFSTLHRFWFAWIPIFFSNFFVYYGFKFWATTRRTLLPKSLLRVVWDYFWLSLTIIYYPVWLTLVTWFALRQNISIALSIGIYIEITRMLMKVHAFLRSNAPRVLSYKEHAEKDILCPSVSQFIYFLWAPTLVYRDAYPRTKGISWKYVGKKGVEFLITLVWLSTIVESYLVNSFNEYGKRPFLWRDVLVTTLGNAGGCFLLTMANFYILLHVWLNAFAELLTFGDRLFYEDWWGSTGYEHYYRTWNPVVHDWLYTYVYKDFLERIVPGNKHIAKYAVFMLSAVFHEYVLAFSFRFFLPVLFAQFITLGTFLTYFKFKPDMLGNAVILYSLGLGNAINCTFMTLEYYARLHCPVENPTVYSYLIPHMFSCNPTGF